MFSPRLRALLNTEWSIGHLRKDSQLRRITNLICDRSKKSKFHIDYKVHLATNLLFLIFATLPCSITPQGNCTALQLKWSISTPKSFAKGRAVRNASFSEHFDHVQMNDPLVILRLTLSLVCKL